MSTEEDGKVSKKLAPTITLPATVDTFLAIGSTSWSLLFSCFVLTLYSDDPQFYLDFKGLLEMIEVLVQEFKGFIPIENDFRLLRQKGPTDLKLLLSQKLIEILDETGKKD